MRLRYFTQIGLFLAFLPVSYSQVIITGIMDATPSGAFPRAIELYVNGKIDLSDYTLQRAANTNSFPDAAATLSGCYTDQFVYLINSQAEFSAIFGSSGDFANTWVDADIISGNGNDAFRIILNSDTSVVDQVGPEADDNNLYLDSYMYRNDNTGPDGSWVTGNWSMGDNDLLDGLSDAQILAAVPFGTYSFTPPGPTASASVSIIGAEPSTDGFFTIILNEPAPVGAVDITYVLSGSADTISDYLDPNGGSISIIEGDSTLQVQITIVDEMDVDPGEDIILTLTSANNGYAFNTSGVTMVLGDDDAGVIATFTIQGSGAASTFAGIPITTGGIVTAVYTGTDELEGFFIQDSLGDGDITTSDGLFIHCAATCPTVAIGDKVEVSGTVGETNDNTELNTITNTINLSSNNSLPNPVNVVLTTAVDDFEPFEGMLIQFPQTLYVTNSFNAARYGEITLSAGSELIQATEDIDPNDSPASGNTFSGSSNVAAVTAKVTANQNSVITMNDGRSDENPSVIPSYFDTNNTIRLGSTVSNLAGIMHYNFDEFRIEPLSNTHPHFSQPFSYAPRPSAPSLPAADITIGSFNVLNYFNGDGLGGGFPTARGADTISEFNRQRDKIISSITMMNVDVLGLIELENDGTGANSALQDLVNGLNSVLGAGTYSFIDDSGITHPDQIRNAIIYKSSDVTPSGSVAASLDAIFSRKPVTQKFTVNEDTTADFVVSINHFKSKGGCNSASGLDTDQGDGQGCYNLRRKDQAAALVTFLTSSFPTDNVIIMGDLNSYLQEDPIDLLRASGFEDRGLGLFSFSFMGESGSLDHALVDIPNPIDLSITGSKWGINYQEPRGLDYNDYNQAVLYNAGPFRSSDHDPIILGLDFSPVLPVELVSFEAGIFNQNAIVLNWVTTSEINNDYFSVEHSLDGKKFNELIQINGHGTSNQNHSYSYIHRNINPASHYYRLRQFDFNGNHYLSEIKKVEITHAKDMAWQLVNSLVESELVINSHNLISYTYTIINSQGMIIKRGKGEYITQNIDMNPYPAGLYYIRMTNSELASVYKFIKS